MKIMKTSKWGKVVNDNFSSYRVGMETDMLVECSSLCFPCSKAYG